VRRRYTDACLTGPMPALANRIRQSRRAALLTQAQLANEVGVNRSAVAQWERKGGPRPTSGNLAKVAVATKVSFDWLATGRGKSRDDGSPADEIPALELRFFARNDFEERMLLGFRAASLQTQAALIALVEREK